MKKYTWIVLIVVVGLLAGCGVRKGERRTVTGDQARTVLARQLPVTIQMDSLSYTVYCTAQAVRDSIVVLSLQPMAGLEVVRVEVTKNAVLGVDRTHKRYCIVPMTQPKKGGKWHSLPLRDGAELYRQLQRAVFSEAGGAVSTEYDGHDLLIQVGSGKRVYDQPFTVRSLKLEEYEEVTAHSLLGM